MSGRKYPPFARKLKPSRWQPNHLFVLTGPGATAQAERLRQLGQSQPALAVPEGATPSSLKWPVCGMDVTVKDYGASTEHAESLCYELLRAGANLIVYVDATSDIISIHRRGEVPNAA